MSKSCRQICMLLLLAAGAIQLQSGSAQAGAWTQPPGGAYLKLASGYFHATHDIDSEGNRIRKPGEGEFREFSLSVYAEYGLPHGVTLVTTVPYKRLQDIRTFAAGVTRERRAGMGDAELRVRKSIWKGSFVASVAAGGKIPTWYEDDPGTRVPLSSRDADWDLRLLLGRSLPSVAGYASGELGYRLRGGNLSNEVFFSAEAGLSTGRFLFKGYLSGIRTRGDCEATAEVGLIGDQNLLKLSPGLIYRLTPDVELSLERFAVVSGCNTTAGATWLLGIAFKR